MPTPSAAPLETLDTIAVTMAPLNNTRMFARPAHQYSALLARPLKVKPRLQNRT